MHPRHAPWHIAQGDTIELKACANAPVNCLGHFLDWSVHWTMKHLDCVAPPSLTCQTPVLLQLVDQLCKGGRRQNSGSLSTATAPAAAALHSSSGGGGAANDSSVASTSHAIASAGLARMVRPPCIAGCKVTSKSVQFDRPLTSARTCLAV